MFKSKFINLILFLGIIYYYKDYKINEKSFLKNIIKTDPKGALMQINDQIIKVNFQSSTELPNENTIWEITEHDNKIIFSWINKDGIEFIQNWNFSNQEQPTLEVIVKHNQINFNINKEISIKLTDKNPKNKIIQYLSKNYNEKNNESSELTAFEEKNGWVGFLLNKTIFCILVEKDKIEMKKDNIKIFKTNQTDKISYDQIKFHSSCTQYALLNNQTIFENLDQTIYFGYKIFGKITKSFYLLLKNIDEHINNIIISSLLLILLLNLLCLPLTLTSVRMQILLGKMQPEIKATEQAFAQNEEAKRNHIAGIHKRYNYSLTKHIAGQVLLMIMLNMFNYIYSNIEFSEIIAYFIPNEQHALGIIMIILFTTMLIYNQILFKNGQTLLAAIFVIFYIGYVPAALIAFIISNWIILFASLILKLKK